MWTSSSLSLSFSHTLPPSLLFIHSSTHSTPREQSIFIDALTSIEVGYPLVGNSWVFHGSQQEYNSTWMDEHIKLTQGRMQKWRAGDGRDFTPWMKAMAR